MSDTASEKKKKNHDKNSAGNKNAEKNKDVKNKDVKNKDVKNKAADSKDSAENSLSENSETVSAEVMADAEAPVRKFNFKKLASVSGVFFTLVVFLAVVAITLYYITTGSKSEFHADCTDTIMWANASHESGHVYDKNFTYACFLPFGVNLIMQPLISIFGLSLKAHIMGMTGFFILLAGFLFLMLREMKFGMKGASISTAIFLAVTLSSSKLREIFWGHTIYYTLGLLFLFIGGFLYFRIINLREKQLRFAEDKKKKKISVIRLSVTACILAVFVLFTATDGISALSIFLLPFIAAICAEYFVDMNNKLISKKTGFVAAFVAILGVMTILGIKLNNHWADGQVAGYQDANSIYSAMSSWTEHIHSLPLAWMELLGVVNMDGQKLADFNGAMNLIRIMNAAVFAVLPVVATVFYSKYGNSTKARALRFWIWIHWAVTAIVLSGYIFGILSAANWRITPVIGTAAVLSILFINWALAELGTVSRVSAILAIPVMAVCVSNLGGVVKMPKDCYKDNVLFGLSDFLEDQGLDYGYATFWNANSITLISDSRVKVRDVAIDSAVVNKRLYQSSSEWYLEQEGQEKYFLLLNDGEYGTLTSSGSPLFGETIDELQTNINNQVFHVLIFDHNIFY